MQKLEEKSPALTNALLVYCATHEISTRSLADQMGVIYQYAWNLLNGNNPMTYSALGRFLLAYGPQEAKELLELAASYETPDRQQVQEAS